MELQTVELVDDPANSWLKELFHCVAEALSPDLESLAFITTDSFDQAKKFLEERVGISRSVEAGMGSIAMQLGSQLDDNVLKPWRGAVEMKSKSVWVIVKPQGIRELGFIYEAVTSGIAHEISEAVVTVHRQLEWNSLGEEQLEILASYHPNPERIIHLIQMTARERLADEYSSKRGFAREMLCSFTESNARDFALGFRVDDITSGSGYPYAHGFVALLAQDKSLSMQKAGQNEIASVCLRILESGMRTAGQPYINFFNEYQNFRNQLLAVDLSAESILSLFNMRCIEFI